MLLSNGLYYLIIAYSTLENGKLVCFRQKAWFTLNSSATMKS